MNTKIKHWSILVICISILSIASGYAAIPHSFTWKSQPWGQMGIVPLENAPYPDPSREKGFTRGNESFPYEGHYDDNSIALVIPPGFKPSSKIDFVVIFHGHRNTAVDFITSYSVGSVWGDCAPNAILVIPQGPKNAPDSGGGKMEKPNGFANMMNELLAALKEDGKIPASAKIGNLVIGGFSGGFRPLAYSIHQGGMTSSIKEVWLFDAAYGFQDYLSEPFLKPGTKKVLRALFTDHQAHENYSIMSHIGKSGNKLVFLVDEELSRSTTSAEDYKACPVHVKGSYPGDDELLRILKNESLVYLHTALPHDGLIFTKRYLADFILGSPWLKQNNPPKSKIELGGSITMSGEWKGK